MTLNRRFQSDSLLLCENMRVTYCIVFAFEALMPLLKDNLDWDSSKQIDHQSTWITSKILQYLNKLVSLSQWHVACMLWHRTKETCFFGEPIKWHKMESMENERIIQNANKHENVQRMWDMLNHYYKTRKIKMNGINRKSSQFKWHKVLRKTSWRPVCCSSEF